MEKVVFSLEYSKNKNVVHTCGARAEIKYGSYAEDSSVEVVLHVLYHFVMFYISADTLNGIEIELLNRPKKGLLLI